MKKQLATILLGLALTALLIACNSDEIKPSIPNPTAHPAAPTNQAKTSPTYIPFTPPTLEPIAIQRDGDGFIIKGTQIGASLPDDEHLILSQGGGYLSNYAHSRYLIDLHTLSMSDISKASGSAVSIDKDWIAWFRNDMPLPGYEKPGQIQVMKLQDLSLHTIWEQGVIAAVLPDSSLLIRTGWVDGPLQLLSPPYDTPPTQIDASGAWTEKWFLSPNGNISAWVEMAPPFDPSHKLPDDYLPMSPWVDDSGAHPQVLSIAFWDRNSGRVWRHGVKGIAWPYIDLFWTKDNQSVIFQTDIIKGQGQIALAKMMLDGTTSTLISYPFYGSMFVFGEGDDQSIYFQLSSWNLNGDRTTEDSNRVTPLERLYPNGTIETVLKDISWGKLGAATDRLLISGDNTWLIDLHAGQINEMHSMEECENEYMEFSPGGKWILNGTQCQPVRLIPAKQN